MKLAIRLLGLGFLLSLSSQSFAMVTVDFVGGGNSATPTISYVTPGNPVTLSGNATSGSEYGLLIELGTDTIGLQTGGLWMQRTGSVTMGVMGNNITEAFTMNSVQVPAVLRIHPTSFLALGVGAVFNFGQGNISITQTDPSNLLGGNKTSSESYSDFGQPTTDTAAVANVEIDIPLASTAHLLLRGEYQYGLTNLDNSGTLNEKINVISYMGGVGFSF